VDQAGIPGGQPDPSQQGPLSRAEAVTMLQRGDELLAAGEFADAGRHYFRVVGSGADDPTLTAAALLGLGEARYRLDDDANALSDWEAVSRMPETPSTYPAWRNIAAARVRAGDLRGALDAYRQADRRAPPDDKAEIASRLGWLTKELGDSRGANRYFARSRGDGLGLPISKVIVAVTAIVSLSAMSSVEGIDLTRLLWLDKFAVADGEYWRLWTVTLLHGSPLHLAFNMYALWVTGPLVERWYGGPRFLLFYLACAATGSVGSFAFGGDVPSVGASGAVFGMFGLLLAAGRIHQPVDRYARAIVGQVAIVILFNLVFGLASGGQIDNAAHIGGLLGGLWLGAVIPPGRVQTLSSRWQRAGTGGMDRVARPPAGLPIVAMAVLVAVVVAGLVYGTAIRADGRRAGTEGGSGVPGTVAVVATLAATEPQPGVPGHAGGAPPGS
jgi:membrane associated rhomboid family serine protease